MIRVKYDTTYPVLDTPTAQIWALGGGVFVAIPIQDHVKAEAGKPVRIRALTDAENRQVAEEMQRIRTLCTGSAQAAEAEVRRALEGKGR